MNRLKDLANLKIAYIGGGSRGWAWNLMSDLAKAEDISGTVALYDIDYEAAHNNEIIGNRIKDLPNCKAKWNYKAVKTIDEAMTGADFVIISILPGTFEEMASDVNVPMMYGIFQSVGDTTGPGGTVRALRTLPMMEEIARAVERNCPDAWVINYTNPMTLCVKALYDTFPGIKAFGCCHEVFGTQKFLSNVVTEMLGIENVERDDIEVNVVGVNHFTWITSAKYKNIDLFPVYDKFCDKYGASGYYKDRPDNWLDNYFLSAEMVKMYLFKTFGSIAAAGDRHLAEFCPGGWFLHDPAQVGKWKFRLTPVSWRLKDLDNRLARSARLVSGEEQFNISDTGEEGVAQIRAILGLGELVTNVNLPNYGQIPNLPLGAVVETNAVFRSDSVMPVMAGNVPENIRPLVSRVCDNQLKLGKAVKERDLEMAYAVLMNDPLMTIDQFAARKMFKKMLENTKKYLTMYDVDSFE